MQAQRRALTGAVHRSVSEDKTPHGKREGETYLTVNAGASRPHHADHIRGPSSRPHVMTCAAAYLCEESALVAAADLGLPDT